MQLAERARDGCGQAEESRQFQRPAKETIEGHAAGILEYQHRPPEVMGERQRARRPVRIKLLSKGIFVFESLQAFQSGVFRGRDYDENGGQFPLPPARVKDVLFGFSQWLEHII